MVPSGHRFFIYGTLLFPQVFKKVTGQELEGVPAILYDYQRYQLKNYDFPGLYPLTGGCVEGMMVVVSPVTARRLDHYEGEIYEKHHVSIEVTGSSCLEMAWVYVIKKKYKGLLSHRLWEKEAFRQQCLSRYLKEMF